MIAILKRLILEFQNRDLGRVVRRDLVFPVVDGKATVVTGMRRTGKTSFCYQKMLELVAGGLERSQILYLNFEDDRLLPFKLENCQSILDAYYSLYPDHRQKECWFFFDEIQNVAGWEHFVRRLLDSTRVHVVLTGSSSKMLTTDMATAMRGRSISKEVLPFSFGEYLRWHQVFDAVPAHLSDDDVARLRHAMDDYFHVGGFAEIYKCPDLATRVEILQEYNDLVVLKDVIERHAVSNVTALRLLLKALYQAAAQKFSVAGFWKTLVKGMQVKCSKNDLYAFMDHLEDACLVHRVPVFSASEKAKMVNPSKAYLIDVGLVRAMVDDPEANQGWLLENLVCLHMRRQRYALHYVNTADGKEVDFHAFNPITRDQKLVQVSWSLANPETRERELAPLAKAGKDLGIKQKLLVTWDEEGTTDDGVQIVPAWKWLAAPGE